MSEEDLKDDQAKKPSVAESKEELSAELGANPVLQKIARLLTNTKSGDWKQGGFELTPEARIPRPIQIHDFVYVRDLPNHSIVVRAATPVSCQYAPGGYKLTALTSGNYSIELRDRVFDPDKLVDPKFASNFKGKYLEILATGEVARKLFEDVRNLVRGNTRNLQQEFDEKSRNLIETILDKTEAKEISDWVRNVAMVDGRDETTYSCSYDGLELKISRSIQGWDAKYQFQIKQGQFIANTQGSTPKLVFQTLEQQEQDTQLGNLEQKLRDLGLEDDLGE